MITTMFLDEKVGEGAWFKCYVPNLKSFEKYIENGMFNAWLDFMDNRMRSKEQLKKYWALIGDIEIYTGYPRFQLHEAFKSTFSEIKGIDPLELTLSTIDMTSLREIIENILEFCMVYNIPLQRDTSNLFKDDIKYLYYLLTQRMCFICGNRGDIHHTTGSRIGMGNNRNKIDNVGREVLCLCRTHHSELHNQSEEVFIKKHHLQPLKLTKELVKELKL